MVKFHTAAFCSPHAFSTGIYLIPWENADIHQEHGIKMIWLPVDMSQNRLHLQYEMTQMKDKTEHLNSSQNCCDIQNIRLFFTTPIEDLLLQV